jgi:hypothetical protein
MVSFFSLLTYRQSSGGTRQIRSFPDWDDNAISGEHLWLATNTSIDVCHAADSCTVGFESFKCAHNKYEIFHKYLVYSSFSPNRKEGIG